MYGHHVLSEQRPEKGSGFPGAEVTSVCELTCGCWESKPGPPQGQQVLLTSGFSGALIFILLFVCLFSRKTSYHRATNPAYWYIFNFRRIASLFPHRGLVLGIGLTLRFRSGTFCCRLMTGKVAIATPSFARLLKRWR